MEALLWQFACGKPKVEQQPAGTGPLRIVLSKPLGCDPLAEKSQSHTQVVGRDQPGAAAAAGEAPKPLMTDDGKDELQLVG